MNNQTMLLVFILSALITFSLRALPFVLFGRKREVSPLIKRLGDLLPYAVISGLVIYCLKDVTTMGLTDNLKLISSVAVVAIVHIFKRNSILSIAVGTALYMLLLHI